MFTKSRGKLVYVVTSEVVLNRGRLGCVKKWLRDPLLPHLHTTACCNGVEMEGEGDGWVM